MLALKLGINHISSDKNAKDTDEYVSICLSLKWHIFLWPFAMALVQNLAEKFLPLDFLC